MRLIVAAETTGKWNFHEHDDTHPSQPHLVRLAAILEDDEANVIDEMCDVVWPDLTWTFEEGAVRAHGIDRIAALAPGKGLVDVMQRAADMTTYGPTTIIGFGVDFQIKVLKRACAEAGITWTDLPKFDCMMEARDIVKQPRMASGGGYMQPSFPNAYRCIARVQLPDLLAMDPVAAGAAKVAAVRTIYHGILRERGGG